MPVSHPLDPHHCHTKGESLGIMLNLGSELRPNVELPQKLIMMAKLSANPTTFPILPSLERGFVVIRLSFEKRLRNSRSPSSSLLYRTGCWPAIHSRRQVFKSREYSRRGGQHPG